jgi:hypothetical protein
LEGCRQICQAKEHDFGLEQALDGDKGGLLFIASPDTNIMIALTNIKLSKDFCILEPINNISNQREWVAILYSDVVLLPIILD